MEWLPKINMLGKKVDRKKRRNGAFCLKKTASGKRLVVVDDMETFSAGYGEFPINGLFHFR